jgi:Raf kinase inhibitor-like YbhB/YbcL family protein
MIEGGRLNPNRLCVAGDTTFEKGGQSMTFKLTSPAFELGRSIPTRYTCDGEDVSPPLRWSDPPAGTRSFALIVDDPDAPAGVWDHWIVFNLPDNLDGLLEKASLPAASRVGQNSWRQARYGGPCPPRGTHRYFFKLYALDTDLNLPAGAAKKQVLKAMEGHILAQAELMGTYSR